MITNFVKIWDTEKIGTICTVKNGVVFFVKFIREHYRRYLLK